MSFLKAQLLIVGREFCQNCLALDKSPGKVGRFFENVE
jgi:hypothetical protein